MGEDALCSRSFRSPPWGKTASKVARARPGAVPVSLALLCLRRALSVWQLVTGLRWWELSRRQGAGWGVAATRGRYLTPAGPPSCHTGWEWEGVCRPAALSASVFLVLPQTEVQTRPTPCAWGLASVSNLRVP